ncbi:MAG: LCP family protein [Eggerthellaceae bacterium]|jgi:LCP family protein required for cell wall assembly|nr:LCP family protein [Eggerthellaceae bacterium]MCH4221612.1 LCP family protein [Eggerthellaceae bacterium]
MAAKKVRGKNNRRPNQSYQDSSSANPYQQPLAGAAQPGGFRPAYIPAHADTMHGNTSRTNNAYSGTANAAGAYQPSTISTYAQHSRSNGRYTHAAQHPHRVRNIVLIVLAVIVCVAVCAGFAFANYVNSINQTISFDDPEEEQAIQEALTPTVSDDPFYIMLIGSDGRSGVEGERSDVNIVARVDPKTAEVTFISIPRDTAIRLDGYGVQKFNAAYAYNGAPGAISAASNLLGVNISHYAEINFDGVTGLVDALGGVTVDVPMAIDDADAGGSVPQGVQTLDGEHALIFARSRSYVTGDFQRTTDQRILLEAIVNKIMTLPATDIPNVVTQLAKCVKTDMNVTDIVSYAQSFRSQPSVTMYSALMPSKTAQLDGVDYVVCDTSKLQTMMDVINDGGDPSTVTSDSTVSSSAEAEKQGQEATPVLVPD